MIINKNRCEGNSIKRLPLALLLGLLTLVVPLEAMSTDQNLLWSLYRDGENAFRQGNELLKTQPEEARQLFRKAALSFEGIVREGGIENGKLFYNLGNTYFRLGDLGQGNRMKFFQRPSK